MTSFHDHFSVLSISAAASRVGLLVYRL